MTNLVGRGHKGALKRRPSEIFGPDFDTRTLHGRGCTDLCLEWLKYARAQPCTRWEEFLPEVKLLLTDVNIQANALDFLIKIISSSNQLFSDEHVINEFFKISKKSPMLTLKVLGALFLSENSEENLQFMLLNVVVPRIINNLDDMNIDESNPDFLLNLDCLRFLLPFVRTEKISFFLEKYVPILIMFIQSQCELTRMKVAETLLSIADLNSYGFLLDLDLESVHRDMKETIYSSQYSWSSSAMRNTFKEYAQMLENEEFIVPTILPPEKLNENSSIDKGKKIRPHSRYGVASVIELLSQIVSDGFSVYYNNQSILYQKTFFLMKKIPSHLIELGRKRANAPQKSQRRHKTEFCYE